MEHEQPLTYQAMLPALHIIPIYLISIQLLSLLWLARWRCCLLCNKRNDGEIVVVLLITSRFLSYQLASQVPSIYQSRAFSFKWHRPLNYFPESLSPSFPTAKELPNNAQDFSKNSIELQTQYNIFLGHLYNSNTLAIARVEITTKVSNSEPR